MEETPLGDKYLFSLKISIPNCHSLPLICLTPDKVKINVPQQVLPLALFTVTCQLTSCPQKCLSLLICAQTEISGQWARRGLPSAGTIQWQQPY